MVRVVRRSSGSARRPFAAGSPARTARPRSSRTADAPPCRTCSAEPEHPGRGLLPPVPVGFLPPVPRQAPATRVIAVHPHDCDSPAWHDQAGLPAGTAASRIA